jgi:hypothetical protein
MEDLDKGIIVMLRIWIPPDHLLSLYYQGQKPYLRAMTNSLPSTFLGGLCCIPAVPPICVRS